jgi:hypothetical protein
MVVLEKEPDVFLVAMFVRGFWLEVRLRPDGGCSARYLYGPRALCSLPVGRA